MKQGFFFLAFVWFTAFSAECLRLSNAWDRLQSLRETVETRQADLARSHETLEAILKQTTAAETELAFLHGLFNLLPQNQSYLRTQKIISDEVQTLRRQAGRKLQDRLHVLVDTKANKLYVKKGLTLLWEADCSVGRGGTLVNKETGQRWEFTTPRGEFKVIGKIENPIWTKPDWAFTESKEPIPPPDDPLRKVEGELGAFVLNLGDGYLIHGTKNENLLGTAVSHGCVRLSAQSLERIYTDVPVGTKVYIY